MPHHFAFKTSVQKYGCKLYSTGQSFGEDPTGQLLETIYAGVSDFERQQNRIRVRQRMQAHLERGNCPWSRLPCGYKRVGKGANKYVVRDEPIAEILGEVFKGFANGRFSTQQAIIHFLKGHPVFCTVYKPKITLSWVKKLLKNPFYAGWIGYQNWEVEQKREHTSQ